jgi:hypothetical protein
MTESSPGTTDLSKLASSISKLSKVLVNVNRLAEQPSSISAAVGSSGNIDKLFTATKEIAVEQSELLLKLNAAAEEANDLALEANDFASEANELALAADKRARSAEADAVLARRHARNANIIAVIATVITAKDQILEFITYLAINLQKLLI